MPCALAQSRTSVLSTPPTVPRLCPGLAAVHRPRPAAPPAHSAPAHLARLGMFGVQVDLILGAVQPEADRALSLAAVKVVDEQDLDLLGYRCFFS